MSVPDVQPARRGPLLDWLVRVNNQVAGWAAQASWWRLVFLSVIIVAAGSIMGEMLRLHHDKVKVPLPARKGESVTMVIDGKTMRIGPHGIQTIKPAPGASGAPA